MLKVDLQPTTCRGKLTFHPVFVAGAGGGVALSLTISSTLRSRLPRWWRGARPGVRASVATTAPRLVTARSLL